MVIGPLESLRRECGCQEAQEYLNVGLGVEGLYWVDFGLMVGLKNYYCCYYYYYYYDDDDDGGHHDDDDDDDDGGGDQDHDD